jgi:hypothetical protein
MEVLGKQVALQRIKQAAESLNTPNGQHKAS